MGFAKPASPSFLLVDFRLKGGQRRCLPMLPHLTKRQRVRLRIDSNEGQQIRVPLIESRRRRSRNDFPRSLDIRQLSGHHALRGSENPATGLENLRFIPTRHGIS